MSLFEERLADLPLVIEGYALERLQRDVSSAFTRVSLVNPKGRAPRNMVIRVQPGTGADFEEKLVRRLPPPGELTPVQPCGATCASTASRSYRSRCAGPMTDRGWKSVGVLELTALPTVDRERWVS